MIIYHFTTVNYYCDFLFGLMNRLFPSRVAPTERETERTMVESHFNLITDGIHPSNKSIRALFVLKE